MSFDKFEHEESPCSCGCCAGEHEHGHEHSHSHSHSCGCEHEEGSEKRDIIGIIIAAALTAVILIFGDVLNAFSPLLYGAVFLVPYLIVGGDVLLSAAKNIAKGKVFDEQFLMSLATIGAFAVGKYGEAVAVMVFYKIGELFEHYAVDKSRHSIAEAMDLRPDSACLIKEGAKITVHPSQVKIGETIFVKPGERIPLDGIIKKGETNLDTSALTGESAPRFAASGDSVLSGCLSLSGAVEIEVSKEYGQSTVAKILELAESASQQKTKAENFITKFSRYYTPVVVIAAVILFALPSIISGNWQEWLNRALIFLVISCPCALVVSVPLTFFAGIGGASRKGIIIKGSNYIDTLSKVKTLVFDKTGTLTKGSFAVQKVHAEKMKPEELIALATAVESGSNHPIAKSICAAAKDLPKIEASEIKELSGKGICAEISGKTVAVGNEKLMKHLGISIEENPTQAPCVYVAVEGKYCGRIEVADEIKEDAPIAISRLKELGVEKTVMLTGDSEAAAKTVAQRLNLDEYHSSLLPADKVERVANLGFGGALCFVGDGINDAPVLARADIGMAMGGVGSDAAIEAADVVIMDDNPAKIPVAIKIAKKTMGIVWQNICFALGVKLVVLVMGAFGIANMWLAVFADVGVTVIAVLNALRAMKGKH